MRLALLTPLQGEKTPKRPHFGARDGDKQYKFADWFFSFSENAI